MSKVILGIDEVGRGCWAGPLVVGAVILGNDILGLNDSKKLTKQNRDALAEIISKNSLYTRLGWVWPEEIDSLGLTKSTALAISRAVMGSPKYDLMIIDGSVNYQPGNSKARIMIGADGTVPAVSAASIIAKIARDKYMEDQSEAYPEYGFGRHVGYGTAIHKQAIINHGISPLHRLSFKPVKLILDKE